MAQLPSKVDPAAKPLRRARYTRKTPRRTDPPDLRLELHRAFGVDLTQIPGINPITAQVLLTEVGPNLSPPFVPGCGLPASYCTKVKHSLGITSTE